MRAGRAEVVGAGVAGLTSAALLARSGWQVRVHERGSLRSVGSAIFLKENSLRVLDELGVSQAVLETAERLQEAELRTERGRFLSGRQLGSDRYICAHRAVLHQAIVDGARAQGAQIETNSPVERALADGTVMLADRAVIEGAELVIGADGVRSQVRDNGPFRARVTTLGEGSLRFLIPREDEGPRIVETWSGPLRVGFSPCSRSETYVFLVAPVRCGPALRTPLDIEFWSRAFPQLGPLIRRLEGAASVYAAHSNVTCEAWSCERLALIGDAAHAQAPNLGQGLGLAVANGKALATTLATSGDVFDGLRAWESGQRKLVDTTQRWSAAYTRLACRCPRPLLPARRRLLWIFTHWGPTRRLWGALTRGEARAPVLAFARPSR